MEYRADINSAAPRTAYDVELDSSSIASFLGTGTLVFLHYLFAPFPWQITGLLDVIAMLEGMLRLGLLVAAVMSIQTASGTTRSVVLILVGLYITISAVWALGTTNYGQGIRHHVLTNWLLIVAAAPYIVSWSGSRRFRYSPHKGSRTS